MFIYFLYYWGFPGGSDGKASAYNAGDLGWIPGSGISPGEGNGNPLQYSNLENPMDGGAWWATVHGVARVGHDWVTSLHFIHYIHIYKLTSTNIEYSLHSQLFSRTRAQGHSSCQYFLYDFWCLFTFQNSWWWNLLSSGHRVC